MSAKNWEFYEEVATHLLDRFAKDFDLGRFEGKQIVPGTSGAEWEIDAKGYSEDGSHFVIVECKRYTKGRVNQAIVGSLAYSIQDTGASGGIVVTPQGLQKGAMKIADHNGIHTVHLNQNSTKTDYMIKFLNKVYLGLSDTCTSTESISIVKKDKDGNVIDT
jgi:hypothetical protein